jgi:hypothetical protein
VTRRHTTWDPFETANHEEDKMEFVLLIYHGTPSGRPVSESISEEEQKGAYAEYSALNKMENMTPGPPLGLPENATTVRVENGSIITTEGPYLDAKGAVGGFYVLEAEDIDAAIAIASRIPPARMGGAVEVRRSEKYW